MKKIYIICPVRHCTKHELTELFEYVGELEKAGNQVFFPHRDSPQEDTTGYNIVVAEVKAIAWADEVHIFWNVKSKGSHFDVGMAFMARQKLKLINDPNDTDCKSYIRVIREVIKNGYKNCDWLI